MKTQFSKFNLGALAFLLFLIAGLGSCKKDKEPTLRESVVGTWDVQSLLFNGVELKGTAITSSQFEFEEYSGDKGDFEWHTYYVDNSSLHIIAEYAIEEEEKDITFLYEDGSTEKFEIALRGDYLIIWGANPNGDQLVMKTNRN